MKSIEASVRKHTPAEIVKSVVVHENGFSSPEVVSKGVVFIWAGWSGISLASYKNLVSVLSQHFLDCSLHVVNADSVDYNRFQEQYGKLKSSGGKGESFWIKNGTVIHQQPSCCMKEFIPEIEQVLARLISSDPGVVDSPLS